MDRNLRTSGFRGNAQDSYPFYPNRSGDCYISLRSDRMIKTLDVESVVRTGEIIEDYPDDTRGHSCLILGFGQDDRSIHVVCVPKDEYLAIITAYIPDPAQWTIDFRRRL